MLRKLFVVLINSLEYCPLIDNHTCFTSVTLFIYYELYTFGIFQLLSSVQTKTILLFNRHSFLIVHLCQILFSVNWRRQKFLEYKRLQMNLDDVMWMVQPRGEWGHTTNPYNRYQRQSWPEAQLIISLGRYAHGKYCESNRE